MRDTISQVHGDQHATQRSWEMGEIPNCLLWQMAGDLGDAISTFDPMRRLSYLPSPSVLTLLRRRRFLPCSPVSSLSACE